MEWSAFLLDSDSRGNRLDSYRVSCRPDQSEFYVQLCCVDEIAAQVGAALAHLDCRTVANPGSQWTHRFRFDGPYLRSLHDLLEFLREAITLRPVHELDLALALDFYKMPDPELHPNDWPNTQAGECVTRAKYWTSDPEEPQRSGRWLADALAKAFDAHPAYNSADVIVAVPGTQTGFGEKLARAVGNRVGKPVIQAKALSSNRRPAKEGHASPDLQPFVVPAIDQGAGVVVVDDVYRSGKTMRGVAVAARAAGAGPVLGLAATRTRRKY